MDFSCTEELALGTDQTRYINSFIDMETVADPSQPIRYANIFIRYI